MRKRLSCLVFLFSILPWLVAQTNVSAPKDVTAWIAAHAVKLKTVEAGHGFDDMQPLKKIVGDARIVSLGEATHGTREFFQLKHRMLEFLATEMGFTIFTIEANMPEAYRLNDYVLNGNGDPAKLLRGMYFWTWDTEEVLDMIRWMREFNKSGKGRVEFTGFDMQTPDVAAEIVRTYVAKAAPDSMTLVQDAIVKAKTASNPQRQPGFGLATAQFPIEEAAGKKIKFSGYIKTDAVNRGYAGLWWRVDGENDSHLVLDNMKDRGATGTTDWKRYEIELVVPANGKRIVFGLLHPGDGTAWFDSLQIEIDGKPYASNVFDFDFESATPKGFSAGGNGYEVQIDKQVFHTGHQSLVSRYKGEPRSNFGVVTGTYPVKGVAGKQITFSGYIKTQDVTDGYAGLWWRVDGPDRATLAMDNMQERGVTGTTDWKRYEITLPVSPDATNINFGCLHTGQGTAWCDSLEVTVDGKPATGIESLDLDFEAERNGSFVMGGAGYRVLLDKDVVHSGKQSVQMKFLQAVAPPARPTLDPKVAAASWKEVIRRLEALRKDGAENQEMDWAIQNARVVLQCLQMHSNEVSRDRAMADNITWILDHSPKAKIVVWAHNGHVATGSYRGYEPMGSVLRKKYGDQMVVFGFSFNQGSFQAIESGKGLHDFTVPPAPAGSLDATLAATGIPIFALDTRQIREAAPANWFNESHKARTVGSVYSEDTSAGYWMDLTVQGTFDVLLFVEKTTAARKNPK